MASVNFHPFGVVLLLGDQEVKQITAAAGVTGGGATLISAALTVFGITASSSVIAAMTAGILTIGSSSLSGCNSKGRGVEITILWVGIPWCRSQ